MVKWQYSLLRLDFAAQVPVGSLLGKQHLRLGSGHVSRFPLIVGSPPELRVPRRGRLL